MPDGKVVAAGESIKVEGSETIESDSSAPDGKVYVLNVYAASDVQYSTANKGSCLMAASSPVTLNW